MKQLIAISLTLLFASSGRTEPEAVTIPLDKIWGYHLPGTRDIAGIPLPETGAKHLVGQTDATFRRDREQYIERMRRALASKPPTERALPGFVIPRQVDFHTLGGASSQLIGDTREIPQRDYTNTYPVGDELTLVFFSHPASYYVRLKDVERKENEITVHYQFEPHTSPEVSVHFALIPLGKLPVGEYRVTYKQVSMDEQYREAGFEPVPSVVFQPK